MNDVLVAQGFDVKRLICGFVGGVVASMLAIAATVAAEATPTVLSEADSDRYRQIFRFQEDGAWGQADALIDDLENDILLGYVLHQRYMHPTAYRSSFSELKRWMAYYADHPNADEIYSLAVKRRPARESNPLRPIPRRWRNAPAKDLHPLIEADYGETSRTRLREIEGRVRYLAKKEQALTALEEIDRHLRNRIVTERQYDRMRSWIAASLYYQGYVDTAKTIATEVAARNGDTAVLAYWIAGLVAYREGDVDAAHKAFTKQAAVPYQEDSLRAAAGFWAARTALADGHIDDVAANLEIAASLPFTFYGQLALAQLGRDYQYAWDAPTLTAEGVAELQAAAPRIRRAIALKEAGRDADADLELRWANGEIGDDLDYELLAVASALELPSAQLDIALAGDGKYLESGLFPLPDYRPDSGFKTDRALLYALMRQESKFRVEATSRVGARGLMQLMPRTASYMANDRSLQRSSGRDRLYDPGFNLDLGQSYVNHLIERTADGDLFQLAAAYNGGPGNLNRWRRELEISDPLLFIESIPNSESRDFVEHVLTNFWIYRARLGQPAPSRERVAAGELPLYEALDQISQQ